MVQFATLVQHLSPQSHHLNISEHIRLYLVCTVYLLSNSVIPIDVQFLLIFTEYLSCYSSLFIYISVHSLPSETSFTFAAPVCLCAVTEEEHMDQKRRSRFLKDKPRIKNSKKRRLCAVHLKGRDRWFCCL